MRSLYLTITLICFTIQSIAQDINNYDFTPGSSRAEKADPTNFNFYLSIGGAFPAPSFREALRGKTSSSGIGFNLGGTYNFFRQHATPPIHLGLETSYYYFGRDSSPGPTSDSYYTYYGIWTLDLLARKHLSNRTGLVPFIDGLAGVNLLRAKTEVSYNDVNLENLVLNAKTTGALNYGLALGFFTRKNYDDPQALRNSFTLKITYLFGSQAEYVIRNSVEIDQNDQVYFRTSATNSSFFTITAGILLY